MNPHSPRAWMVTGSAGVGKTTFCRLLDAHARKAGWNVSGILSPAVMQGGIKLGIMVEDLLSGASRPLASKFQWSPFRARVGRWFFDPEALAWGNWVLETCPPCDLLIVDEIGPLELKFGCGWISALELFRQADYRLGVVVVRGKLREKARALLPIDDAICIDETIPIDIQLTQFWHRISHDP